MSGLSECKSGPRRECILRRRTAVARDLWADTLGTRMDAEDSVEVIVVLGCALRGKRVGGNEKYQPKSQKRTDERFQATSPFGLELVARVCRAVAT